MGILGNLQQYMQYQTAEAIPDMAKNEGLAGGLAGAGLGAGFGIAMGNQMAGAMAQPGQVQPPPSPGAAPPPIPQPIQYFAVVNGQQAGPFDQAALQRYMQAGSITRETLVWKQGMAAWTAAGQVPDVAGLFATPPPPPPGMGGPPPIPGS